MSTFARIEKFIAVLALWRERKSKLTEDYWRSKKNLDLFINSVNLKTQDHCNLSQEINFLERLFEKNFETVLEKNAISLNKGLNFDLFADTKQTFDAVFIDDEFALEHKLEASLNSNGWYTLQVPLSHKYNVCLLLSNEDNLVQLSRIGKVNPNLAQLEYLNEHQQYELGAVEHIHSTIYEVNSSSFIMFPKSPAYKVAEGKDNYFAVVGVRVLD